MFGETTDISKAQVKRSGILLSWASACFIVAIGFIAATQLLYTEAVIIQLLAQKERSLQKSVVRVGLACFAWIALGFQTAAMLMTGQALKIFAPGPVILANYGLAGSAALVVVIVLIGMTSEQKGRKKLAMLWTLGGLLLCRGRRK